MPERTVVVRVRRQDGVDRPETRRWETFEVPHVARMTVATVLRAIQSHPVTTAGVEVAPVAWDCGCLAEACGACAMVIDGRARLACSARVDALSPKGRPIVLEPLGKFPLVRDLLVDRARLFEHLRRVRAFIETDGTSPVGPAARQSQAAQAALLPFGGCTSCGLCLEACPQYGEHSDFVGAAALGEVYRLNAHPVGALQRGDRLAAVMGPGGVADCGHAENCVEVCPVGIPLLDAIQRVARASSRVLIADWLLG
jgi:succinate dehydrogenase / fumarate reductase, iron-sulfur subunit